MYDEGCMRDSRFSETTGVTPWCCERNVLGVLREASFVVDTSSARAQHAWVLVWWCLVPQTTTYPVLVHERRARYSKSMLASRLVLYSTA
jgi:hypothetical protein